MTAALGLTWRIVDPAYDRDVTELIEDDSDSITYALLGGCADAECRINVPPQEFPALGMQSRLVISAPDGEPIWDGFVTDPGASDDDDAAYLDLSAVGSMVLASDTLMPLVYLDPDVDGWRQPAAYSNDAQRFEAGTDDAGVTSLLIGFGAGYAVDDTNPSTVEYIRLTGSEQSVGAVTFTVQSGVTTGWSVDVQALAAGAVTATTTWACSTAATPRTVTFAAGTDEIRLRMRRTGGATNVTTDTVWTRFTNPKVYGSRMDRFGVTDTTTPATLTSAQVVADAIGRGLLGPVDAAGAEITDSGVTHSRLVFADGVRGSMLLDALRETDTAMLWSYGVKRALGYEFSWWANGTEPRYNVLDLDAVTRPGTEVTACQRIRVAYTDAEGKQRSTLVTEATDAGLRVRDADPITMDGIHTQAEAITEGQKALAELAHPAETGTIGINRRVYDRAAGCDVEPYLTRPGLCRLPGGELVIINEVTIDSDGANWSIGSEAMTDAEKIAAIQRGEIQPGKPIIRPPAPVAAQPKVAPIAPATSAPVAARGASLPMAVATQPQITQVYEAIDTATAPLYPTDPPATSPAFTVYGMPTSFVLHADPTAATTTLTWYVGPTSTFADATVVGSSRSSVFSVTAPGAGQSFALETDYFFWVVASNDVGAAPESGPVTGRLDLGAIPTVVAQQIIAASIDAESLHAGTVTVDASGVTVERADGTTTVISALEDSVFSGGINADWANVASLILSGVDNYINGTVTLGAGAVTTPSQPLTLWSDYATPTQLADATGRTGFYDSLRGLCRTGSEWLSASVAAHYWGVWEIVTWDSAGGWTARAANLVSFNPFGGTVKVGTSFYVLGWDYDRNAWYVYIYDASGTKTGGWPVPGVAADDSLALGVAASGSDLMIAQRTTAGALSVRVFSTAGGFIGTGVSGVTWADVDLVGVVWRNSRYYVATTTAGIRAFNGATRYTVDEFPAATPNLRGLAYDGTTFHSVGADGKITRYETTNDTAAYPQVAYSWADIDPGGLGTAETLPSVRQSTAALKRFARWRVRLPSNPPDDGTVDGANAARIYFSETPGGTLYLRSELTGTTTAFGPMPAAGKPAETVDGFASRPGAAPGRLVSAKVAGGSPVIDLSGDGAGRTGPLSWTSTGVGSARSMFQSGVVTVTPASAGVDTTATVTFAEPFAAAPAVVVDSNTGTTGTANQVTTCKPFGVSATGFSILLNRTTTSATLIGWAAFAKTQ